MNCLKHKLICLKAAKSILIEFNRIAANAVVILRCLIFGAKAFTILKTKIMSDNEKNLNPQGNQPGQETKTKPETSQQQKDPNKGTSQQKEDERRPENKSNNPGGDSAKNTPPKRTETNEDETDENKKKESERNRETDPDRKSKDPVADKEKSGSPWQSTGRDETKKGL